MRDAKPIPHAPPEGPVRFRAPLMKLAWNEHGRDRLAVALFFSWIGLAVGLTAVLVLLRVSVDALYDYVFPATATTSLALLWSGYATSSSPVLRAALERSGTDPRIRERWGLIVGFLDRYGDHGAPKGMFSLLAIGLALPFVAAFGSNAGGLSLQMLSWGLANLALSTVLHAVVLHRWNGLARELELRGFPLLGYLTSGAYGMRRIRGVVLRGKMHRFLAMTVEEQEEGITTRCLYETPGLSYRVHVVEADGTTYFVPPLESSESHSVNAAEAAVRWPDLWTEARRLEHSGSSPLGSSSRPTTDDVLLR